MVYLRRNISRIVLFLTVAESIFVLSAILNSPSEAENARLFGLSATRLVLFSGSLLVSLLTLGVLVFSFLKPKRYFKLETKAQAQIEKRRVFAFLIGLCLLGLYCGLQLAMFSSSVQEPVARAVLTRLQPLFIWMALLSFQFVVLFSFWQPDLKEFWKVSKRGIILACVIFAMLLSMWLWIARMGYGFAEETKASGYFRVVGTPVTGFQVFLAFLLAFGVAALWRLFDAGKNNLFSDLFHRKELVIGFGLWLLTFALWMSTPLVPSWFADAPRPPNETFSPNSDALLYDTIGQSLLVGSGFSHPHWGEQTRRPALTGSIALFHAIRGLGFEEIIVLQVGLLSVYPVIIYLFTKNLHNRISGLMAAALIMLRERNAILLADDITVSHAKILMSDLPATLGVVLFLWLIYRWMDKPENKTHLALISGGVMGFFVLIRAEIGLLMMFAGVASLWLFRRKPRVWVSGMAALGIGFLLMVVPWTWRNWRISGVLYMDTPLNMQRLENLFEDYLEPFLNEEAASQEVPIAAAAFKQASLINVFPGSPVEGQVGDEARSRSDNILNHFFNGQTQYVYYLPMYPNGISALANLISDRSLQGFWDSCCNVEKYVRNLPYWWSWWQGEVAALSILPLGIMLFILSSGIAMLWKQKGFLGIMPLFAGTFHVLYFALNRRSGGRWILEYDWFSVVILSVALVGITQGVLVWLRTGSPQRVSGISGSQNAQVVQRGQNKRLLFIPLFILAIGAALPISEMLIPQQYPESSIPQKIEDLLHADLSPRQKDQLERLLAADPSIHFGRALYPRYYDGGDGVDGWKDNYKLEYSRLEFYLVGSKNSRAVIPYNSVIDFSHAQDILMLGCGGSRYFDTVALVFYQPGSHILQQIVFRQLTSAETSDCLTDIELERIDS
jgi:hypothetical protein